MTTMTTPANTPDNPTASAAANTIETVFELADLIAGAVNAGTRSVNVEVKEAGREREGARRTIPGGDFTAERAAELMGPGHWKLRGRIAGRWTNTVDFDVAGPSTPPVTLPAPAPAPAMPAALDLSPASLLTMMHQQSTAMMTNMMGLLTAVMSKGNGLDAATLLKALENRTPVGELVSAVQAVQNLAGGESAGGESDLAALMPLLQPLIAKLSETAPGPTLPPGYVAVPRAQLAAIRSRLTAGRAPSAPSATPATQPPGPGVAPAAGNGQPGAPSPVAPPAPAGGATALQLAPAAPDWQRQVAEVLASMLPRPDLFSSPVVASAVIDVLDGVDNGDGGVVAQIAAASDDQLAAFIGAYFPAADPARVREVAECLRAELEDDQDDDQDEPPGAIPIRPAAIPIGADGKPAPRGGGGA